MCCVLSLLFLLSLSFFSFLFSFSFLNLNKANNSLTIQLQEIDNHVTEKHKTTHRKLAAAKHQTVAQMIA